MTMTEARGRGRDKLIVTSYVKGKWTFSTDFINRAILSVVVDAKDVEQVVDTIVSSASMKGVGDGKILVFAVERTIDISSGETDDHAITST
jgi:nitrogen regulatory protein PII